MITRFEQQGVTQHTGKFFTLNYDQLKEPILAQDEEYKATVDAWQTYSENIAAKDYLPQDMEVAQQKREDLYQQESALRQSVGGDLLDPRYQSGMRALTLKEASDPFYKNAAYNYKMYHEVHLPEWQEYMSKNKELPSDWQNSYGARMKNYQGALSDGKIEYSPIEGRIPFQESAVEFLKPILTKKLSHHELQTREMRTPDGRKISYLVKKGGARLTRDDIKEMMKGSTLYGRAYEQLQMDFAESPQLNTQYKDFQDYFNNGVLDSIGAVLEYDWSEETFQSWTPRDDKFGSRKTRSIRPRTGGKKDFKIRMSADLEVQGAASPVGLPDHQRTMQAEHYYHSQKRDFLNGYTDYDDEGNIIQHPPLDTKIMTYLVADVDMSIAEGMKVEVAPLSGTNQLSINLTYKDPLGNERTIDMLGPDAWRRKSELPEELRNNFDEAWLAAHEASSDYTKMESVVQQISDFKNRAGSVAFTDAKWSEMNQKARAQDVSPFVAILTPNERKELIKSPLVMMAEALQQGRLDELGIPDLGNAGSSTPLITGFASDTGGGSIQDVQAVDYSKDLVEFSKMLGIDTETWKRSPGEAVYREDLAFFMQEIERRQEQGSLYIPGDLTKQAQAQKALEIKEKAGDTDVKEYLQAFSDNWQYGVDFDLNRRSDEQNLSGVRQQTRQIYHFNQANSTGSESGDQFRKAANELIGNALAAKTGGDSDQSSTFSAVPIYNFHTNKEADASEYKKLGMTEEGEPVGYSLVGFAVDDEGFNIVLRMNDDALGDKQTNYFEIRDENMVRNIMVASGMGNELALETMRKAITGFQIGENDDFVGNEMSRGQSRSAAVSEIGLGMVKRPVERLMYPAKDPVTGRVHPEGTFKYYSLSKKKHIYATSMSDITNEFFQDESYVLNRSGEMSSVTPDTFDGQIDGIDSLMSTGHNMLHSTMIDVLTSFANSSTRPGGSLRMTSAFRDSAHPLSLENPRSPHMLGRAADFSVKKSDGSLNEELIDWFFDQYNELRDLGIKVQVEFPSATHEKYREFAQKYNEDFVRPVKHATGIHVHVHYDEAAYKRRQAELEQLQLAN